MTDDVRPAFYALRRGGWRDYVTLLHPPYTLWHLSYVALGAGLAPTFHVDRLAWALASFFLALGVSAHALDELHGRPLGTVISAHVLVALAVAGLAGAIAIGIGASAAWGWWLLAFVAAGGALVPAYNLEWFGGLVHNEWGFALAWGAFPALTGYFVEAERLRPAAIGVALYATALSFVQRRLSTHVRRRRRALQTTAGTERAEAALRALTVATTALSIAVVAARLS